MDEEPLTVVSPRHAVRLASEYLPFLKQAPSKDFVVRTIAQREHEGTPLMSADIVIAGRETREQFPLAVTYPLHFRKTYYPGRLHGDPKHELECQARASELIGSPPPIGYTERTFRSCLVPGAPYSRLSPFGVEPEEANLTRASALPLPAAIGLWTLLEKAFAQLRALHAGGLAHGDAELHNFIVCPSPLEVLPIDFEVGVARDQSEPERFVKTCESDLIPLLREATLVQCRIGKQAGELASLAADRIAKCFKNPNRFKQEIDTSGSGSA
jgi:hypothetical protein